MGARLNRLVIVPFLILSTACAGGARTTTLPDEDEPPKPGKEFVFELRGRKHKITMPYGWDVKSEDSTIRFVPPAGHAAAGFEAFLTAIDGPAAATPDLFVRRLADDEALMFMRKAKVVPLDPADLLGGASTRVKIEGSAAGGELLRAEYAGVTIDGVFYLLGVRGGKGNLDRLERPLTAIKDGLQPGALPSEEEVAAQVPGERDYPAWINDPLWGLDVHGLSEDWRLSYGYDAYVLRGEGHQVVIRYQEYDSKFNQKTVEMVRRKAEDEGRGGETEVDGQRAFIVDRALIVPLHSHALIFLFDGDPYTSGMATLEKAIQLPEPVSLYSGDLTFNLSSIVYIDLKSPWRVAAPRPGGASFVYANRVWVRSLVRPAPASGSSFDTELWPPRACSG